MNKAFEKILKRLDVLIEESYYKATEGSHNAGIRNSSYHKVKKIVQEVAEEYNGGWIPIVEKLPPDDSFVLLSFSNFSVPIVGRYEEDEDGGGNFFAGDEDEPLISQDLFVNAWMPLPKPYEEIQYTANNK